MNKDISNKTHPIVKQLVSEYQNVKYKILASDYIGFSPIPGQEFHTTGALTVKKTKYNNETVLYVAVETKEGFELPLRSLMNISCLNGYFSEGVFPSEKIVDGEVKISEHEANVVDDFDFSMVYQPSTRNFLGYLEDVAKNSFFFNKVVRYLGNVIRPFEAKKDSLASFPEKYLAGMKRIKSQPLWEIIDTPEVARQKLEEAERRRAYEATIEHQRWLEEKKQELARFNERNAFDRDRFLVFDSDSHTYSVNGLRLQSVTDFVEHCFPNFDSFSYAKRVAESTGRQVKDILDEWEYKRDESARLGTLLHSKIENFLKNCSVQSDDSFKLFRQFADRIVLKPFRTEWAVYDTTYNLAGTIDYIDCMNVDSVTERYIIYDWKRSNKVIKNGMPLKISKFGTKANYPIDYLEDCSYYKYALQLSLYKFIVERNYSEPRSGKKIKIDELRLGIFHPDYQKPYILKMPYLENEINLLMALRNELIL